MQQLHHFTRDNKPLDKETAKNHMKHQEVKGMCLQNHKRCLRKISPAIFCDLYAAQCASWRRKHDTGNK